MLCRDVMKAPKVSPLGDVYTEQCKRRALQLCLCSREGVFVGTCAGGAGGCALRWWLFARLCLAEQHPGAGSLLPGIGARETPSVRAVSFSACTSAPCVLETAHYLP